MTDLFSSTRLETALRKLRRTGLIDDETPAPDLRSLTFTMHRIVQRVARNELGRRAKALRATALLAAVFPSGSKPGYSPNYPLCARLTPHVLAMHACGGAPNVEAWDYLLNQAGIYLSAIADHPGRLPLAQQCLRVMHARGLPESDPAIGVAHANLGMAHRRLREWDQAEAELAKALALDAAHRPSTASNASHLDMMGGLMLDLALDGEIDRLDCAIRLRQKALAIRRHLAGRRSEAVAEMLNNLGMARDLQGRKRAAARLYMAALSIRRGLLEPNDARLGLTAMKLGALWLVSGEAAKAEPLLLEALDIYQAAFTAQPQHPDRRSAAGWLISCLLVRARTRGNRGARKAEAKRLCAQYGFAYAEQIALAHQYPDRPA